MLSMRLYRVGKKNQPSYKIVVTDKRRAAHGGRFVAQVGFYNPLTKEKIFHADPIKRWLSKGVQPSATVFNLLRKEGIVAGAKLPKHSKPKEKKKK